MQNKTDLTTDKLKEEISLLLKSNAHTLPSERLLAQEYGVSRYTIRHAISKLAQEGYVKSIQGSGNILTGKDPLSQKNTVLLIVNTDSEYIYPSAIELLGKKFKQIGYTLRVVTTNYDYSLERHYLLEADGADYIGIIIEPCYSAYMTPNSDLFDKIYSDGFPLLFINGIYPNVKNFPVVKDDNISGGYLAGEYLSQNYHARISAILQSDNISGQEKLIGLYDFINHSSVELRNENTYFFLTRDLYDLQKRQNTDFIIKYIDKYINDCTAIVCQNDEIAYYLIKELGIRGIFVPNDLSVISFDNSFMSDISRIPITSLAHERHLKVDIIADTFMDILKGKRNIYISLPWYINEKSSSTSIG